MSFSSWERGMKSWFALLAISMLVIVVACTDFHTDVELSGLTSDSDLSFPHGTSEASVRIRSFSRWNIASCPEWVSIVSIISDKTDPYQWIVAFRADANRGADREGTILLSNEITSSTIHVTQEGIKVPFEAVDLGLSVKWATFNLGAIASWEFGDYYAWGEIEPKNDYRWETYKWCHGNYDSIFKYSSSIDNKMTLDPEDDAAHVFLGGKWRMPTIDELNELSTQCKWTWISVNQVEGYLVESKSNGNSIFVPAAGYMMDSDLQHRGEGFYWSSSQNNSSGYSLFFDPYSRFSIRQMQWDSPRKNGYPIRPVEEY